MAQSWYSVVEDELASVDEAVRKGIRTSYPELYEMCETALRSRYHEVRPALGILSYYANGGKERSEAVANAVCFKASFDGLHMHDLIDQDGKVLQTQKKKLFAKEPSTTKVIVAGDFLYVIGFRQAYSSSPKAVPYMMQAAASITDATFDTVNKSRDPEISEEDVMTVMRKKGAIEYQIIMESAAEQAGADEASLERMRECGLQIGTAVQIRNDMEDLFGYDGEAPRCHTLIAGSPSLILYHAMKEPAIGQAVREAITDAGMGIKEARSIAASIKGTDAVARCMNVIDECKKKASELLKGLPESEYRAALMGFLEIL